MFKANKKRSKFDQLAPLLYTRARARVRIYNYIYKNNTVSAWVRHKCVGFFYRCATRVSVRKGSFTRGKTRRFSHVQNFSVYHMENCLQQFPTWKTATTTTKNCRLAAAFSVTQRKKKKRAACHRREWEMPSGQTIL